MGHPVGTLNQAKALVGAFSVIVSLQSLRRFVPSSNSKTLEMVVSVDGRHLIRQLTVGLQCPASRAARSTMAGVTHMNKLEPRLRVTILNQ